MGMKRQQYTIDYYKKKYELYKHALEIACAEIVNNKSDCAFEVCPQDTKVETCDPSLCEERAILMEAKEQLKIKEE
jgi:hypothetical protein